jgi:hypothetical protein
MRRGDRQFSRDDQITGKVLAVYGSGLIDALVVLHPHFSCDGPFKNDTAPKS